MLMFGKQFRRLVVVRCEDKQYLRSFIAKTCRLSVATNFIDSGVWRFAKCADYFNDVADARTSLGLERTKFLSKRPSFAFILGLRLAVFLGGLPVI